jgi:hypothetical protein
MAENTGNLVSIKVSPAAWGWIEDEKERSRKAGRKKPTTADVVDRLISTRDQGDTDTPQRPASDSGTSEGIAINESEAHDLLQGLTPEQLKQVERLVALMREDDERLLASVQAMLSFWEYENERRAEQETAKESRVDTGKGPGRRRSAG